MVFPRTLPYRPFAEPIDDFGADEVFLQNVVAPAPVAAPAPAPIAAPIAAPAPDLTPAVVPEVNGLPDFSNMVNPFTGETFGSVDYAPLLKQAEEAQAKEKLISDLTGQLSSQWQEYGLDPSIKGINRANELAQILAHYGITDLSQFGLKQTPYEEQVNVGGGENAQDIWETRKGTRGQLTYGDKTYGHLIGFGSKGQQEFLTRDPFEYLQDYGDQGYKLAGSAAGKGAVDYILLKDAQGNLRKDAQGRPVLIPQWRSTSDIGDIAPLLTVASFIPGVAPFAAAANAALSLSQGDVLGGIASLAGLGGFTDVANAARLASAVKNEDILGAVMPGLGLAGVSDVGGFSTKDIGKAVNVARAIERENPLALVGAASAYLPGPNMPGLFVDENIQEGFFEPGGPGYIEPTTAPAPLFPEFDQPLLTEDPTDWAALYAQPTTDPVTGQTIVGADQAGYPAQDFGVAPQSDINEVYNRIANDMGGFASTWQTVGSDRVMVQDDGSAIGINTETNESYALTPEETQRMVDAGLLNTADSGYETAIRGEPPPPPSAPAPSAAAPAPGKPAAPKGPAFDPNVLFALGMAMTPQQKAEEDYQLAQILGVDSPFGRIV